MNGRLLPALLPLALASAPAPAPPEVAVLLERQRAIEEELGAIQGAFAAESLTMSSCAMRSK